MSKILDYILLCTYIICLFLPLIHIKFFIFHINLSWIDIIKNFLNRNEYVMISLITVSLGIILYLVGTTLSKYIIKIMGIILLLLTPSGIIYYLLDQSINPLSVLDIGFYGMLFSSLSG